MERGYKLYLANSAVIRRRQDPYTGDPLESGGLSAGGGVIRIRLAHWRSAGGWGTYNNTLSFRWDGRAFRLIGFDCNHLQRNAAETEEVSVNFLTVKAWVARGSMRNNAREKVAWKVLPRQLIATLEHFGNG